jgi:hypothetical protein
MASDSTSIDNLPGGNDMSKTNKVVLEKTELNHAPQGAPHGAPQGAPHGAPHGVPAAELSSNSINKIITGIQQASQSGMTQLPSSHISMQTHSHMQDPQIQPNYVPTPSKTDYIEQHDSIESIIQQNKTKEKEEDRLDMLYSEMQTPLLVMVLFFIFQMPFFQNKFKKTFPSLFLADGNNNISGYLVKTMLFGGFFYGINKATNYLSEV